MGKLNKSLTDKMRLNIEFASNGIIIRDFDDEDNAILSITKDEITKEGFVDHSNEYKDIGMLVYKMMEHKITELEKEIFVTNIDLDITATCAGRPIPR